MRDRPHPNHKLEWPGGVVPEWARPQQNGKKRFGKGARGKGERQGGSSPSKRERLQKVMAQSGHGSRRNIEILIAQGHITINGQVAKLGDSVGPGDKVKLDGNLINLRFGDPLPRVLIYNKPDNEIVTRDDPEKRATVFDRLPKVHGGRWVSVGRLDLNTGGLLLFTTNGELANRLTHPRFEVEREYAVRLLGTLTDEQVEKLTKTGVDVDGEVCTFDSLEDRGGEGANHWYHVVLREGRNREVRKMMEAVGMVVSRLMRVRFGNVMLPGHIKRGMFRDMEEEQVQELLAFAGMNEPPPSESASEEDEEDETDNIGNRFNAPPPRELSDQELDELVAARVHRLQQQPKPDLEHEPDGNRGTYVPGGAPDTGNRPPKKGRRPQGQPGQAERQGQPGQPRHGKPHGGKPFAFNKQKRHGKGGGGPHQRKEADGNVGNVGNAGTVAAEGNLAPAAPRQQQGHGPGGQPGAGKPGRNRRNKNRNRNRGGGGGAGAGGGGGGNPGNAGNSGGGAQMRGEQQPASNGNREPY